MLFEVSSSKPLETITRDLEQAAARRKFGILAAHNLRETMAKKGVQYPGECLIFEVCNPQQAKRVLEVNPAASAALPCRISVYASGGGYTLSTIRPTLMMRMLGGAGLEAVAHEVEEALMEIMREAA